MPSPCRVVYGGVEKEKGINGDIVRYRECAQQADEQCAQQVSNVLEPMKPFELCA